MGPYYFFAISANPQRTLRSRLLLQSAPRRIAEHAEKGRRLQKLLKKHNEKS